MIDLKAEFKASMARQLAAGTRHPIEIPKRPYHAKRLYPHARKIIPPAHSSGTRFNPERKAACDRCGEPVRTKAAEGSEVVCMPCRMASATTPRYRETKCSCGKRIKTRKPVGEEATCRACTGRMNLQRSAA